MSMTNKIFTRAFLEKIEGSDQVDAQRRALARIQGLPVRRILDLVQYLQSQVVAALDKNPGRKAERDMFVEICDLLLWSVAADERAQYAERKIGLAQVERQLLLDRLELAERELSRYQTCEELLTTDFLNHYVEGAARRINELKNSDKKKK
jgi:choline kinase